MKARFAQYADLNGILELYKFLVPDDSAEAPNYVSSVWNQIIKDSDTYRYAVIEDEGKIAATCNIVIVPNLTHAGRPYAVIENVITHPDSRRKGFGSEVIQLLLDYAKEKNCYKVMLLSGSHRKEAHEFYKSLGFDGDIKRGFAYYML